MHKFDICDTMSLEDHFHFMFRWRMYNHHQGEGVHTESCDATGEVKFLLLCTHCENHSTEIYVHRARPALCAHCKDFVSRILNSCVTVGTFLVNDATKMHGVNNVVKRTVHVQLLLLQWCYSPYRVLGSSTRYFQNSLSLALVFHASMPSNSTPGSLIAIAVFVLCSFFLSEACHEVLKQYFFFKGWGCQPHAQPATWRTRASLFWGVITFDLSGMGGPSSSYATATIALGISWPHKPHHYVKVGGPSGGHGQLTLKNLLNCPRVNRDVLCLLKYDTRSSGRYIVKL
jgi:hypothetical protein